MDDHYSPQPSTSEVKDIIENSDEAASEDFEEEELEVNTPSPKVTSLKVKVKRWVAARTAVCLLRLRGIRGQYS